MLEPHIPLDRSDEIRGTTRKRARIRHALPPPEFRDWLTPTETALTLGCSVSTVHRMRRGRIVATRPLPYSQYGRNAVFRKASPPRCHHEHEKTRRAQGGG